jgi:hypothetical protein
LSTSQLLSRNEEQLIQTQTLPPELLLSATQGSSTTPNSLSRWSLALKSEYCELPNMQPASAILSVLRKERELDCRRVDVVAGNSLFHIVDDSDDTATKILAVLNKDKAGRVTFMPVNRIRHYSWIKELCEC